MSQKLMLGSSALLLCLVVCIGICSAYPQCPEGCVCMTDAAAQTLGLDYCPGDKVQCGHQETPEGEIPMYCFQSGVTSTTVPPAGTPDLVIQDVWYYGDIEGVYTEIRYDIKNRGDGPAGASTTALYIDGVKVAEDSVAALAAGESRIRQVSYSATCSGDGDTFAADADFHNAVAESDETNNHRERTYPCPSAISIPDFFMVEVWHEGEEVYYYDYRDYTATEPISFRVKNIGDASTPSATARLYVDGVWSSSRSVPSLAPGEEYSGYFSYIGSCSAGQDTIRVVIDEEAMVTELDETNNEKTVTWLSYVEPPTGELPDLVIEHISVTEEETDSVTFPNGTVVTYPSMWRVSYRIRNAGAGYSPSSETGLFIDGVNHGRDYVPPLAPGESSDEEFMGLYPTSFCTGTHDSFTVMADYESLVAESNNINNQMPYTFTCIEIPTTPVLAPDLNITAVWYEPAGGIENLRIYYTVRNIGDAAAGASTTKIYIGYSEFATDRVPALAAGAEVTRSFTTLWTPRWESNYVEVALDRDNEVSEATPENPGEMNNVYRDTWIFAPSCSDGVRNRDETGVDCGGYYCRPCAYCDDGIRNGDETGVDCGGTYCPPCSPCSTSAKWAPTDGPCTTCWPTSEGPTIGMNTNDDSCAIVEVCDPNLDYIVADAITCAEHPDYATRFTGANAAEKVCACTNARAGSGIDASFNLVTYKKTLGMYAIYALGSCHAYMQGYFYGEWCCYGSDGICGDNTDCGYWSVLPAAWDMGTAASCSHRPEPTPDFMMGGHRCVHKSFLWWDWGKAGYWSSDTNFRSNSDSVCDVPAHASINRLSTGTCVDYSFALTTILRKMGYSRSAVYSVNGEGHGYNLVMFPGETKWHYVDTVGNRGGEITGGTGYDSPNTWYDYCRKMDEGCSNDYWSQSTGNCPTNSNIYGCEGV